MLSFVRNTVETVDLTAWIIAAIAAVVALLIVASRRFSGGRFELLVDDAREFVFKTDLGLFTIDRIGRTFQGGDPEGGFDVSLDDIDRLDVAPAFRKAWWNDVILWGRLLRPEPDMISFSVVSVVTLEDTIPVFEIGRFEGDSGLFVTVFAAMTRLLPRLGFAEDIDAATSHTLRTLEGAFAKSGYDITRTPKAKKQPVASPIG